MKFILGIESSCDDTSVALVVLENKTVLDCLTISSSSIQNKYGGVVPEIAAREHERNFLPLLQDLFNKHHINWSDIAYIAYTSTPGLVSCLFVGIVLAKTISLIYNIPLIPIDHVHGHIFSIGITNPITYPFLSLVVSGKTTAFHYVYSPTNIVLLEKTSDNAIGEAYDKVARIMGLPYPGGIHIDQLYDEKIETVDLIKRSQKTTDPISYSGFISAFQRLWEQVKESKDITNKEPYMSTCFQACIINNLINKIKYWSRQKNSQTLFVSGGVAANSYLKSQLSLLNIKTFIVDKQYAGDNAAMIAYMASWLI